MNDAEWEQEIAKQDAQRAAEKATRKAEAKRRLLSVTPSAARMQALRPPPPPEPDEERKRWTAADAFSIVGEKQRKKAAARRPNRVSLMETHGFVIAPTEWPPTHDRTAA
jgi:hypothetical protein